LTFSACIQVRSLQLFSRDSEPLRRELHDSRLPLLRDSRLPLLLQLAKLRLKDGLPLKDDRVPYEVDNVPSLLKFTLRPALVEHEARETPNAPGSTGFFAASSSISKMTCRCCRGGASDTNAILPSAGRPWSPA